MCYAARMREYAMRRAERQLSREDAERILAEGEYGVLCICSEEGEPYGVPLSYVYQEGVIYFHCAPDVGHKLALLAQNGRVCFTVVGKTEVLPSRFSTRYESVMAFGSAVPEVEHKREALRALVKKYSPGFVAEGEAYMEKAFGKVAVYAVRVERLTAKGRR